MHFHLILFTLLETPLDIGHYYTAFIIRWIHARESILELKSNFDCAFCLFHAGSLLDLLLNPEDDMFLRNVG
jgi:hypothetical protein